VSGAGGIEAVDNGDAATVEPFHADHRKAFNGLALLIVRSKSGAPGPIAVAASSDGLAAGQVDIVAQAMTPKQ
jgi:beta-galactosidase